MRKRTLIAATVLFAPAAHIWAQGTLLTDTAIARQVDSIAKRVLQSTGVPSASVAVVKNGRLAYVNSYGCARLNPCVNASPDMRYAIGSISKQFTAVAILLLQQEGKLKLDDAVSRFIPGLTRGNEVTVRQLLSHTSGYQDFWPQDYLMPMMLKATTPQAIADQWAKKPLDFDPGSRWQYSNTNYTLAGMVVEKASGMPFFQFVRTRILQPAGLTSAADFDASPRAATATGYIRYGLGPLRVAPDAGSGWMWAAGELAMTAKDLANWDINLIRHGLLTPSSYRELEREIVLNNGAGTGYALGLDVSMQGGRFMIEHSGEVSGFTAENMVFPEDSAAVVVLTNQDAAPASGAIANQIAQALFTTEDKLAANRTAQARSIFEGLQRGTIDRSLFTSNANAYFSDQALKDFASSLAPLGAPTGFVQTRTTLRGGMTYRSYRVTFPNRVLRVWTYEIPDGKLEQYQVAPVG
ncbi:MAG TPA: serine hydrolase domain-containing protein [Gemmatimonadaceae bacterium]|nr:serine hydrolase domain-containing protein [Gemmatimonadaceae bacterium]